MMKLDHRLDKQFRKLINDAAWLKLLSKAKAKSIIKKLGGKK